MSHIRRYARCRIVPALGAFALLAGLSACTNGKFNGGPVVDAGLDLFGYGKTAEPAPEEAAPSIGPPLIVGYRTTRVAIPSVGARGQSRYFVAPDGVEIAMNQGFVTRVVGLGVNLEGMFLPAESPYLNDFVDSARKGEVTDRTADYYRKGRILHDHFRCALTYVPREGTKGIVNEQCRRFFGGPGFRNTYWTDGGSIVCSLQWFHPDADPLQFFQTAQQAQSLDLTKQGC